MILFLKFADSDSQLLTGYKENLFQNKDWSDSKRPTFKLTPIFARCYCRFHG